MGKGWLDLYTDIETTEPIHLNMFMLQSRGEIVERSVYEFFEMLGDIGGFNDGLYMVLGYFMLLANSRSYFVKLSLSVFKTANSPD